MPHPDAALLAALDAVSAHFPTVTALTLEDDEGSLIVYAIEQYPVPNLDNPGDPDYPFSEVDINAALHHHLAGLQVSDLVTAAAALQRNGHRVLINDTTAWIGLRPMAHADPRTATPTTQTPLQAARARLQAAHAELLAAHAALHVQELVALVHQIHRDHPDAHTVSLIRWPDPDDIDGDPVTTDQGFDQPSVETEGRHHTERDIPPAGSRLGAAAHTHPLRADTGNDGDATRVVAASTDPTPTHPTSTTRAWESVPAPSPDPPPAATSEPGSPTPGRTI